MLSTTPLSFGRSPKELRETMGRRGAEAGDRTQKKEERLVREMDKGKRGEKTHAVPSREHVDGWGTEKKPSPVGERLEADCSSEEAVDEDVGVSADGGGEVCVQRHCQAVVQKLWPRVLSRVEVDRLRHAPRRHDPAKKGDGQ